MADIQNIDAPERICIYLDDDATHNTVRFLNNLSVMARFKPVCINMQSVKYVSGGAGLVFFAHVNALQLFHQNANWITFKFPKKKSNPEGYDYVVQRGLARALLSGSEKALATLSSSSFPLQSSNSPDTHAPLLIDKLSKTLGLPKSHDFVLAVNTAVNEAMLNVCQHAYIDVGNDFFDGVLKNRWWQLAIYNKSKGEFIFLIYDLGVGLAESYHRSLDEKKAPQHVFEEALCHGFSRFSREQPWRGNGSEDMKHPVESNESLFIWCNNMKYLFRGHDVQAVIQPTIVNLRGTLVEWSLKLAQGESV
ncbi:hypothetical protein [Aeromonas veronii]|uniref:hypothetical protein n=1 Tax=Aeromonas veronii TaxID=654 RepID=UPI0035B741B4